MVDKTGIKATQIFGWDSEPKTERKSITGTADAATDRSPAKGAPPDNQTDWAARRQPPNERDQSLSFVAVAWEQTFAPGDRPANLCVLYPRVANRLALCWPDAGLTLTLLESLLVDKRGKRQGFPAPVKEELVRLRGLRAQPKSA